MSKTPYGADVLVVVRIECVTKERVMHRLEWGFRWMAERWRISQRYGRQDTRGAQTYPWNDMFDVLIGGRRFAYHTSLVWVYSRAERVMRGESQWGGDEGMVVPWKYSIGEKEKEEVEKVWTAEAVGEGRGEVLEDTKRGRRMTL